MAISLPVIVVLDNIRSLYNTGAFFRTAGGCAVEKLVLCGITPRPDQGGRQRRSIAKTALGAELAVRWEYEAERVVQSIPLLDDEALRAVRNWHFAPTIVNGQPVPVRMNVTVNFSLPPTPAPPTPPR